MSKASKANPTPIFDGVTAILGDTFILKSVRNRLVMKGKPKPRTKNSKKQQEAIDRFKDAQRYARRTLKEPGIKELYSKGISGKLKGAHQVAASDYLYPPKIHYVKLDQYHGIAGDVLRIKATDDFKVTEVQVRITVRGKFLEQGNAECYRRKAFMWLYKTTIANPDLKNTVILIIARDRPGNQAVLEVKVENAASRGL